LRALAKEFREHAEFAMVYISEAHAADTWPISSSRFAFDGKEVHVATPLDDAQRCDLAARFAEDYGIEGWATTYVDCVEDNPFRAMYAAWPIRFYVLMRDAEQHVKVELKLQPKGAAYDLAEVREFLSVVKEAKTAAHQLEPH